MATIFAMLCGTFTVLASLFGTVVLVRKNRELKRAQEIAAQCMRERNDAVAIADAATRRADNQFHCIEDTVNEREAIWVLYREQSLTAGAAQDLLWSELERMRRFMVVKGKQHNFDVLPPSEELMRVLGVYSHHRDENAAKEALQKIKSERVAAEKRLFRG